MNPRSKNALVLAGAALVAVFLGWEIAEGSYFWPALAVALAGGAVAVRLTGAPFDVVMLGGVTFGYIAANRGFAQLMPPGIPLFPAEAALLIAGGWRLVAWARERRLPLWRDAIAVLVIAWLVVGSARFVFDLRSYGLSAARDFAMVYYAAFYFIARDLAQEPGKRGFIVGCIVAALALLAVVGPLYDTYPDFFHRTFQIGGVPLIYFKGDLLNTYLGIAAVVLFQICPPRAHRWLLPLTTAIFAWVLFGGNRASALGLAAAATLLFAGGQRRFATMHVGVAIGAAVVVLGLASLANNDWAERRARGVQDRVLSVVDFRGTGAYASDDSANKGDNNRFRLTWWRNVLAETWQSNPVLGLGFGHDLAAGFVREYYPDTGEEFATRSPHNIFVTVAGRLGLVGLVVWTTLCAALVRLMWRHVRSGDPQEAGLAAAIGVILISSCFGVVLEGPMGAVPFWVLLGLASNEPEPETPETASGKP